MFGVLRRIGQQGGRYDLSTVKRRERERERERERRGDERENITCNKQIQSGTW